MFRNKLTQANIKKTGYTRKDKQSILVKGIVYENGKIDWLSNIILKTVEK